MKIRALANGDVIEENEDAETTDRAIADLKSKLIRASRLQRRIHRTRG